MSTHQEIPIACDLTALPAEVREQHLSEGVKLLQAAAEVQELPNGYAFRFASEPGTLMALAKFVEYERLCCPFYAFVIEVEPGGGSLWLCMTGGKGVKEFEQALLINGSEALHNQLVNTGGNDALGEAVVKAAAGLSKTLHQSKR